MAIFSKHNSYCFKVRFRRRGSVSSHQSIPGVWAWKANKWGVFSVLCGSLPPPHPAPHQGHTDIYIWDFLTTLICSHVPLQGSKYLAVGTGALHQTQWSFSDLLQGVRDEFSHQPLCSVVVRAGQTAVLTSRRPFSDVTSSNTWRPWTETHWWMGVFFCLFFQKRTILKWDSTYRKNITEQTSKRYFEILIKENVLCKGISRLKIKKRLIS